MRFGDARIRLRKAYSATGFRGPMGLMGRANLDCASRVLLRRIAHSPCRPFVPHPAFSVTGARFCPLSLRSTATIQTSSSKCSRVEKQQTS
jgi:hypothetical protein